MANKAKDTKLVKALTLYEKRIGESYEATQKRVAKQTSRLHKSKMKGVLSEQEALLTGLKIKLENVVYNIDNNTYFNDAVSSLDEDHFPSYLSNFNTAVQNELKLTSQKEELDALIENQEFIISKIKVAITML